MRQLMDEEGPCIEEVVPVQVFPLIRQGPCLEARTGQWIRRRTEAEHVEDECLAVPFPAVTQEAMFWLPTMGHGCTIPLRPAPIAAPAQGVSPHPRFDPQLPLDRQDRG